MNHHTFDTKLFDASLKDESIMPFIDFVKDANNIKTYKHLANTMSYTLEEILKKIHQTIQINIESVTESTFQKNISKWKNRIELPSFIHMLVITNTKNYDTRDHKIAFLFQLLLIRGLLHIQNSFNIDEHTKYSFLKNFQDFRKQIKSRFDFNKIAELQAKHLIVISENIYTDIPITKNLNFIFEQFKSFMKNYFTGDEPIKIEFPNKNEIHNLFNEKKYVEAMNLIHIINNNTNEVSHIILNQTSYLMRFIIAIKLEDTNMIQKYFNEFDKHTLGCILSFSNKKFNSQELIKLLKNVDSLIECIDIIALHVKTKYQL